MSWSSGLGACRSATGCRTGGDPDHQRPVFASGSAMVKVSGSVQIDQEVAAA
jgi:hypothetical protein